MEGAWLGWRVMHGDAEQAGGRREVIGSEIGRRT